MRFFVTLSVFVTSALAAVAPLRTVEKYHGETNGRYIVTLKDGSTKSDLFGQLRLSKSNITHDWDIVNGFAGHFNADTLNSLRSNPAVESVAEDGIMHAFGTQTNAPWGIARVFSNGPTGGSAGALTFSYSWADDKLGAGVDIYVVDTGVRTTHIVFGGRARWGATFGGYASADGNGHGTHCAGTAAGGQTGIAKNANIIAVKVLDDSGSGAITDIVSGLNWVKSQASASGRPSIVSMSLGGGATATLDNAVTSLLSGGVHVAVAAGNSNVDAINTSPARVPGAITVGASTITDSKASFSNYGSILDIWAPGQDVISAWSTSDTAANIISGTSMATPHVAGAIAYLIAKEGNASPAAISDRIKALALKNVLSGIPAGTTNALLHMI
jgi:cerevisin